MSTRHRMTTTRFIALLIMCISASTILFAGCNTNEEPATTQPPAQIDRAPTVYDGKESFQNRCAVCHGQQADGTATGPPLVNRLYEIGHHPNFSFHNAVNKGVIAHHWNFGDMPPIPNVEPAEVDAIICHIRDLQRAEGIAAGEAC